MQTNSTSLFHYLMTGTSKQGLYFLEKKTDTSKKEKKRGKEGGKGRSESQTNVKSYCENQHRYCVPVKAIKDASIMLEKLSFSHKELFEIFQFAFIRLASRGRGHFSFYLFLSSFQYFGCVHSVWECGWVYPCRKRF